MKTNENRQKDKNNIERRLINFRVSDDEYRKIERLVTQSGLATRSDFIKKCIFENSDFNEKGEEKLRKQWKVVEQLLRKIKTGTLLRNNTNV